MNGFMNWMEKHFMPIAAKIGSQKHLVAIRDGFISIMPVTMVGSFAVLLNVFFRDLPNTWWGEGNSFTTAMTQVINVNGNVYFGSIVILGLCFTFALGYHLAKSYDVNPIAGGVVAFASVVACMSQGVTASFNMTNIAPDVAKALTDAGLTVGAANDAGVSAIGGVGTWGNLGSSYTGAAGLFTCLIVGLLSSMIYIKLMIKKITIKLPDTVPPAVSNAFAAIIPGIIAIYVFGIITQLCVVSTGLYPNDLILKYIQQPMLEMSQGFFSVILIVFLVQLFWFFGLHGSNVMAPIIEGIYTPALLDNLDVFNKTHSTETMKYVWTRGSFDAYAQMGGSGVTLGLIIAIFLFSKRDDSKAVAKLAAPMGVFNINEPIIFGMPIVLNPVYIIPWLLVPPVCAAIAYGFTVAGIIPPVFVQVPWVMPVGFYAWMGTGGNIMAALVSILCLGVSFLLWTPFVMLANRMQAKEEAAADAVAE
ncbi:PTS sugar transporter subunit IIC [Amedibacillus sp. YH-ame6]